MIVFLWVGRAATSESELFVTGSPQSDRYNLQIFSRKCSLVSIHDASLARCIDSVFRGMALIPKKLDQFEVRSQLLCR